MVISNLGPKGENDNAQVCDYQSIVLMVRLCKMTDFGQKKFTIISSLYVTRPLTFVAFFLNSMVPNVLGWKVMAENELRKSKLNYLIVRPGRLVDTESKEKDLGKILYSQGDKIKGQICRQNLARVLLGLVNESSLPSRTTIDVVEGGEGLNISTIKPDTEKDIIKADHFNTTKTITMILYSIVFVLGLYAIMRFHRN